MIRTFLKSKIHRATITAVNLDYEGSIGIDENLLHASGIMPFEQVHVLNLNNGERFETYAIGVARGSGAVTLNGAAARRGMPGDTVIIVAYGVLDGHERVGYTPLIVSVDSKNRITVKNPVRD